MNDFILSTELLTEFELSSPQEHKIRAVIVCQNKLESLYNEDLMGKGVKEWVVDSLKAFETQEIYIDDNKKSLIEIVEPFIKDEDYLIVLYADTPLITENVIFDAVEYATTKNLDFCKLYRGAIIKTDAIRKGSFEYSSEANFLDKEAFYAVFDNKAITHARKVLKNRILDDFVKNGVKFFDKSSCYIESNVEIASNVKIYANNVIKNYSKIMQGSVLGENNIIINSEIGENCQIISSYIQNEKIKKGSKIGPFVKLNGAKK